METVIAGIDYSMTCPALCIHKGKTFSIDNCKFFYLTDMKKYVGLFKNATIEGIALPKFNSNAERYDLNSEIFIDLVTKYQVTGVGIEDYAFAAKGLVFHIGENTGILKHKLMRKSIPFSVYSPPSVKKSATGSGKADKDVMYKAFLEQTGLDLVKELAYNKSKIVSPIGDIVDSYFLCKHHFDKLT